MTTPHKSLKAMLEQVRREVEACPAWLREIYERNRIAEERRREAQKR